MEVILYQWAQNVHMYMWDLKDIVEPMSNSLWHKSLKKANKYKLYWNQYIIFQIRTYLHNGNRFQLDLNMGSLSMKELKADAFWSYFSLPHKHKRKFSFVNFMSTNHCQKNIFQTLIHLWTMVPATGSTVATTVNIPRLISLQTRL